MDSDFATTRIAVTETLLLAYQRRAVFAPPRFTWNNWARQSGKSFAFTLRRLLRGLCRGRTQLMLSASGRQSRELMAKLHEHCDALITAFERRGHDMRRRFTFRVMETRLPPNIRIIALPANPLTTRGFTADIFLDEFAMHHNDRAVWSALLPTLLRNAGEADIASTPRGRAGAFYRLHDNPDLCGTTVTLPAAIAQGLDVDGESLHAALADERLYRSELLCEFDAGQDAFLRHETIEACVAAGATKRPDFALLNDPQSEFYGGMDVGRVRDLTVIWLWQRVGEEFWTRGVWELSQTPTPEQHRLVALILHCRGVRRICIDATGMGRALLDFAMDTAGDHRVEGVSFDLGRQSGMAARLRSLAEQGRLRIPADEAIRSDWHSLQRIVTAAGHIRLKAPHTESGHADRFWAAALGLEAAAGSVQGPAEWEFSGAMDFARRGAL